jgi:hypothetical protein
MKQKPRKKHDGAYFFAHHATISFSVAAFLDRISAFAVRRNRFAAASANA